MQFNFVHQVFGEPSRPVVCDTATNSNPFGATMLYAYPGLVFEVQKNQHIVSLCVVANIDQYV